MRHAASITRLAEFDGQRLGKKMALQDQNIEQNEIVIEVDDASSRQSLVPMLIAGLVLGIVGMGVALLLS